MVISGDKRCAITVIIERRTDVRKRPIRASFPALSPAVKPPQASYRPHVRLTGAYVAFRNRISNRGGASGNESSGIHTAPLEWKAVVSNGLQSMPFHGMPTRSGAPWVRGRLGSTPGVTSAPAAGFGSWPTWRYWPIRCRPSAISHSGIGIPTADDRRQPASPDGRRSRPVIPMNRRDAAYAVVKCGHNGTST